MGQDPRPSGQLDEKEAVLRSIRAGKIFTPASPIHSRELFAGRIDQVRQVIDAIYQLGQHAVLYGERGVGKTSLANMIGPVLAEAGSNAVTVKVNVDGTDTFGGAWRKALEQFAFLRKSGIGFEPEQATERRSITDSLSEDPRPNDVLGVIRFLNSRLVFIFDEFDRMERDEARVFTDLIKAISDYGVETTVVLVGVAGTVDQLLEDHASIERALTQIPMPRMTEEETGDLLQRGAKDLEIEFAPEAIVQIARLSQGLPHYTHLIALHSVREALGRLSPRIEVADVVAGVGRSVENAQHSIKTQYQKATTSAQKQALFEQILLACALAHKDPLSTFQPTDVVEPMSTIMGKHYEISTFSRHLQEFCSDARGPVLVRSGEQRRYRYRFSNPLLQPYVVMRGLSDGVVSAEALQNFGPPPAP